MQGTMPLPWRILAQVMLVFCMQQASASSRGLATIDSTLGAGNDTAAQLQVDRPVQILAFGDSLTEGYYSAGDLFHPYSIELQRLLTAKNFPAVVTTMGVTGERVAPAMTDRFADTLQNASKAGIHYDIVVLLGGINDIGYKTHTSTVFDGITTMIREAVTHKTKMLILTLLGTKAFNTKHDEARIHLNRRLRLLANHPEFGDSITILDMDIALPFGDSQNAGLYDDGLHLSPKGYDRMGTLVYTALLPLLTKAPAL